MTVSWFTPATVVAPSMLRVNASFCALLIDVKLFKLFFAVVLAWAKFCAPFNACSLVVTCDVACVIVFGSIVGFDVWLMIAFAAVTALSYSLRLFGLASV